MSTILGISSNRIDGHLSPMPEIVETSSPEEFFAAQAQDWDARYQSRTYRERRELVQQIVKTELDRLARTPENIDVLDFGCGGGVLLSDLVELGVSGVGVDSSRLMIDDARTRLAAANGHVKVEHLSNSLAEGIYQGQTYDIVICTSVLEFVPDLGTTLSRLSSLVRSGGMLLISVPNRRSFLRKIEHFIYRHPRLFRYFSRFDRLNYLRYQQHQLTLHEVDRMAAARGLRREQYRFHVAPRLAGPLERAEMVGMMLVATFRK